MRLDLQKTQNLAPRTFGAIYTVYIRSVDYRDKPGITGIVGCCTAQQLSHGGTVSLVPGTYMYGSNHNYNIRTRKSVLHKIGCDENEQTNFIDYNKR